MKSNWLRSIISNPLLKIFSIALAIALSLLVREDRIKEITVEVPLILADLGEDKVFTGELRPSVRVRMRGRSSSILRVIERNPSDYQYTVDLRGYEIGDTYVFEEERLSRLIGVPGVSVVAIEPPAFSADVEPRLEKEVPVELESIGSPDPEFEVDVSQIRYNPKRIKLSGPPSQLKEVDSLRIAVDLTGLSKDVIRDVRLKTPLGAEHMGLEFETVTVDVPVKEKMGEGVIQGVTVEVRGCEPDIECNASPVTVSLKAKGPLWRIRQLQESPEEGLVYLDAGKFPPRTRPFRRVRLHTRKVDGLILVNDPSTATLTVRSMVSENQPTEERGDSSSSKDDQNTPDETPKSGDGKTD
jgi:YbbR domain-containing protein